ncbi:zinc-dependent metalloprotease family protein [Falsiroseomonas sp. HW251]|uniref:zinc-dependent metalloprotease family protein n=1 Tax=Falsiroseomonas sp. HW251 TaxID=3390998 RepID=UPI003D31F6BA
MRSWKLGRDTDEPGNGLGLDDGPPGLVSAWDIHLSTLQLLTEAARQNAAEGLETALAKGHDALVPIPDLMPHGAEHNEAGLHGFPGTDPAPGRGGHSGPAQPGGEPQGIVFDPTVRLVVVDGAGVGAAFGDTFKLHSQPTSPYRIYLDFDGHTTTGTAWNNDSRWGATHYATAFSTDGSEAFVESELLKIQQIWARVAEYFSPFNIDVTTEDPGISGLRRDATDADGYGIRVVITDEYDPNKAWGGIAYVGVFGNMTYSPAFVYSQRLGPDDVKFIADAIAHEAGHNLGLSHDGRTLTTGTEDYYYGHGSGATDWAPIMGVGYNANIVQWSKGEYYQANQLQDDLSIITTNNGGVTYRADDYGNTFATAASLNGTVANGIATVNTYGVISGSGANNDIDMFVFNVAAGGSLALNVTDYTRAYVSGSATPLFSESSFSMLDIKMTLYDASFAQVAVIDDTTRIDGTLSLTNLAGGTYYLALDGTGWGSPTATTPTGYTEYGSLGQYRLSGTYTASSTPVVSLSSSMTNVTTREGGSSQTVTITATNATGPIALQITGLDATEGTLSSNQLTLTATGTPNVYAGSFTITGRDDRDDDGNVAYNLLVSGAGLPGLQIAVTNQDDEAAPNGIGAAVAVDPRRPATSSGATLSSLQFDDGVAMRITEGGAKGAYSLEWRYQFSGLAVGSYTLQSDAAGGAEAMRLQTAVLAAGATPGTGTSWTTLAGLSGDYGVTIGAANSTLWVRFVDTVRSSDGTKDVLSVDLLTLEPVAAAPGAPAAADWVFA